MLHHLIQFGEDRLFDVHFLEDGFDDDVAILDVVVARDRMDAGKPAGHFVFFEAAAPDRRRVVGAYPFHAAIERFLCRIDDFHVVTEIGERIRTQTCNKIELTSVVDPDILGGIVLRVGDFILDASIRNSLSQLRKQVAHAARPPASVKEPLNADQA